LPLVAIEGVSVPFIGIDGTPTCDLPDFDIDEVQENYFSDYFEVYVPGNDAATNANTLATTIIEIAVVSAAAVMGALFLGGFI
jgi:hypothetical protein